MLIRNFGFDDAIWSCRPPKGETPHGPCTDTENSPPSPDDRPLLSLIPASVRTRTIVLALSILALAVLLPDLGGRTIWDDDEARRTQVAAEMVETGNWLVPRVGGQVFAPYPPLDYWLIALPGTIFGIHETTARFPSALAAWGVVLAVFWIGLRAMDRDRGAASAAILALTPGFVHMGRVVAPDMLLLLSQCLLLACFLEWLRDRESGGRRSWPV